MHVLLFSTVVRLPRLRGDGPWVQWDNRNPPEAAPPTRGWTAGDGGALLMATGCPAYAGDGPAEDR